MTTELRACVDESQSGAIPGPGAQILAASIGRIETEPDTRDLIKRLRLPGQVKLHWRDEDENRRSAIISEIADLDLEHIVVVRARSLDDRPERRRRKCFEALLYQLRRMKVDDIVLESRGLADDRRDIEMLNALRGRGSISTSTRLRHEIGRSEPLLWVPDAMCGVVTGVRVGNPTHRAFYTARIRLIEISSTAKSRAPGPAVRQDIPGLTSPVLERRGSVH